MSRDSAKAHYTKQPGDPDEGFITASDAQAAIDDIYDDMSAPAVIADGSVTSGKIAADAVGSAQIATGAVGSGELATDAVTSDKIADGAVSNAHVASDAAIAASKVAGTAVTQADTGTVTNGMLAGSIAKTKVAGTAITAADTGTVTGTMIAAGAVDNGNLAANAVNEAKIASGAVTTVKIADDAVTSDKIADNAVTAAQIAANAVGASELADNAVDTAAIAADAVTADKIANDTITAAELAANSVGTSELANDSVTAAKILDGTITANEIQNASITGAKLVNDTITATQIAANAVGASELADNAVDTNAIANDAVTAAKIAADAVGSSEIAAGAVGTSELADAAVTAAKLGSDVRIGNLLTANQASATDASGDTTGFLAINSTLASVSGAFQGSKCLEVTYVGTNPRADMWATSSASSNGTMPVTAGETYTFSAMVKSASSTGGLQLQIYWWTSAGNVAASTASVSLPNAYLSSTWTRQQITAVAPADAAYASFRIFGGISAGQTFLIDALSFHRGAAGTFALPGVPVTGQSHIATNGAVHLSGTGSPEGVVTAAPGSTWLQTDATTDVKGWIRWVKASGTGNTGWVAGPEADTGWRDISSSLNTGVAKSASSGAAAICRVGDVVQVHFNVTISAGSVTQLTSGALTTGFRPSSKIPIGIVGVSTASSADAALGTTAALGYYAQTSPIRLVASAPNPGTVTWTASWITDDAWPSSLPGSAA